MKTVKKNPLLLITSVLFAFTACVLGADSALNTKDQKFIKDTGEAGLAEVKIATLGTQKAERADVKEFATMLVTDHTKMNTELAELAKSKNVELSAVISAKGSDKFKELEKETGKDFDNAFLAHMEDCHEDSVAAFEEAGKDAADTAVKDWANATLPTLKAHLQKVRDLRAR